MTYGTPIDEVAGIDADRFRDQILPAARPVIMRGLAGEWPAVTVGDALPDYLLRFGGTAPCDLVAGPASIGGRFRI